jgi:hypothetical protein
MTTQVDLTNRALAQIGTRSQILSMTDGSQEALYANLLYAGLRDFLLREGDYEFCTTVIVPVVVATAPPWLYSYAYPGDCVRIKQMVPVNYSRLDPTAVEFTVTEGSTGPGSKAVATNVAVQYMLYTHNTVLETAWDSMFTEAFVRMLGSALAFALENRIEASREKLQQAIEFAGMASLKDG